MGPNVCIYTACHPVEASERNTFRQWAEGVTISDNVWIGGNVVILPCAKSDQTFLFGILF